MSVPNQREQVLSQQHHPDPVIQSGEPRPVHFLLGSQATLCKLEVLPPHGFCLELQTSVNNADRLS